MEKVLYFDSYIVIDPTDTPLTRGQLLSDEKYMDALETYAGSGNDGARIEEMLVVTKDGYRMLSKFPSKNLISCPCVGAMIP